MTDDCIDCGLCVPACPVNAISADADVPADQQMFIDINRELAEVWSTIVERKPAPDDAHQWAAVKDKLSQLSR